MSPPTRRCPASLSLALAVAASARLALSCGAVPTDPNPQPSTPTPAWGTAHDGLQSRITADRLEFPAAADIPLRYSIRNASDHPLKVWHNGFWPTNRIDVTDSAGHAAALTKKGERHRDAFGVAVEKNHPVTLQPGQVDEDFPVLNLRDYFILQSPGTYTVQYTYRTVAQSVTSNTLQITVARE